MIQHTPEGLYRPDFRITNEGERVRQFKDQIDRLDGTEIIDFNLNFDLDFPVDFAIKQFTLQENNSRYKLYLPPSLGQDDAIVDNFYPRISRVGKRTGHGVFFGDISFTNGNKIGVAVKPHWTEPVTSCLRDYINNIGITQLGIETLQSSGFLLGYDNTPAYSMTLLEDDLTTLDSIDWRNFYPDVEKDQGMINIWKSVAQNLAYIHAIGSINHGDLDARNIAQTSAGNLFFIDWERANVSLQKPRDAEVRYGYSHPDLYAILKSMCESTKVGLGIYYKKPGDYWDSFHDLILDHYKNDRLEYAQSGTHHGTTLAEVAEEIEELEKTLKAEMTMLRQIC